MALTLFIESSYGKRKKIEITYNTVKCKVDKPNREKRLYN